VKGDIENILELRVSSSLHGLLAFVPLLAIPCTDQPKEGKIKVTMLVILASENGNEIDKQIKNIAEEVQKLNPNFTSFKYKAYECQSLARDEKGMFKTLDKKVAMVVIRQAADAENRVILAVTPPDQAEIEYRCACGKFLPIITRYQTKKKERLILAVRVEPCNKGK
jgi:hypothetical protein